MDYTLDNAHRRQINHRERAAQLMLQPEVTGFLAQSIFPCFLLHVLFLLSGPDLCAPPGGVTHSETIQVK